MAYVLNPVSACLMPVTTGSPRWSGWNRGGLKVGGILTTVH